MATGLVVADDDISVGGRVTPGDNLGRLSAVQRFTSTSDTDLATCAGGGTDISGGGATMIVPTAGTIEVSILEAEFDETGGSTYAHLGLGLDVGGTVAFVQSDSGAASYVMYVPGLIIATSETVTTSGAMAQQALHATSASFKVQFDIATYFSGVTGSQTVKVLMGDNAHGSYAGAGRAHGTEKTIVMEVRMIDGS